MTSYPARIEAAWISLESMMRQTVKPEKIVLVLCEDEFRNRTLPKNLLALGKRGLDIVWVKRNGRSFDKLLPTMGLFPDTAIVTVDDDKIFPRTLLAQLYDASLRFPSHAIGARGWRMMKNVDTGAVEFGVKWERAFPGETGTHLFMPGGNGCLYPPGSLDEQVKELDLALRLCPTADDIWFWASLQRTQTRSVCLGLPPHKKVGQQDATPALSDVNDNDPQFQAAIGHFALHVDALAQETA